MARKPRIHHKDAVYHVVLKGLDGAVIFRKKSDRSAWDSLVEEGCSRFGHRILAYCCLKGQINLCVQVSDTPLSRIMQNLSFRYTRYFNRQHDLDGPLFRGRYKAILIDPADYLNDLVRYIHNLPVGQKGIKSAADYLWSSHSGYMGKTHAPWLSTDRVLKAFGGTSKSAKKAFGKYVDDGRHENRADLTRGNEGGRLLGGKKFQQKALKPVKKTIPNATLPQLVRHICRAEGVSEAKLKNGSRARYESQMRQLITCIAMELDIATLSDMAKRFNRDLTTMSRNQRYFREKMADDPELRKVVKTYKIEINSL